MSTSKKEFTFYRETPNYYCYVAATGKADELEYLYLPKAFGRRHSFMGITGTMPPSTGMEPNEPCCHRDTDGDGNCTIHLAPGVLRPTTHRRFAVRVPPGTYDADIDDVRELSGGRMAIQMKLHDKCQRPFGILSERQVSTFGIVSQVANLTRRVYALENPPKKAKKRNSLKRKAAKRRR